MKHECEIIRDLMPLCIDETASVKAREAVDAHVAECKPCEQVYAEMKSAENIPVPQSRDNPEFARAVRRMKKHRKRRVWLTLLLGVVIAAVVALAGIGGYYWYCMQEVIISPESLSFEQSMDGIAMVKAVNIPQGADMKMLIRQHDRDGDGTLNFEMYLYLTATRAEMKNTGQTSYHFVFGTAKNGKVYMSNGGAAPVEIEQIMHGTPTQGGMIVYVGAGMKVTALHGLTIKSPEIIWQENGLHNAFQVFVTHAPQP